jgi:hypothetical protein
VIGVIAGHLRKDAVVSWQGLNVGTIQLDGAEFSGGTVD